MQALQEATGLTSAQITGQEQSISPEQYAKLFVKYVDLFTDVSVLGITDHNTGNELDCLISEATSTERGIVILPGVEVASNQGIHILCLFDPAKKWRATWAESIDHLLTEFGLTASRFNTQGQPLNTGKSAQEIMQLVSDKAGLCIFAHIGTDNGLFKYSNTASGGTAHIDIYTDPHCQIVQLPHTATLSSGVQNIINGRDPHYGSKVVTQIKCSDARKLTEIGTRFVWIKADATFDGLKQIIFEPDERIKIQDQSPYNDHKKIHFSHFGLEGSTNFVMPDTAIPLNRELVTIIGGRGSGKSTLLEIFAFFNEEHLKIDQNGKKRIIEFYRSNDYHADPAPSFNAKTTIVDKDGERQEVQKQLHDQESLELPFLYLGQEQLSALATNDAELTKTVCDLIGIDVTEFQQQPHIFRARQILAELRNTQQAIQDIFENYRKAGYDQTTDFENWVSAYVAKLAAQQKRLSSKDTRAALEDINTKTQRGLKLKELLASADMVLQQLGGLEINSNLEELNTTILELYPANPSIPLLDVSSQVDKIAAVKAQITSEVQVLQAGITQKKSELTKLGIKEDINSLLQSSNALQQNINNAKKDLGAFKRAKQQLTEHLESRNDILTEVKSGLETLRDQIYSKFHEFQGSHKDSDQQEKELFEKIISGIDVKGELVFHEDIFCKTILERFVDNRKLRTKNNVREDIAGIHPDGTAKRISIEAIAAWVQQDLEAKDYFNRGGIDGILNYIFTEWPTFLTVRAVVKLNGKPIEVLSIGQRGTLLLKVFLATASARQVFIIDQPEDNLDNSFITHELVPLIRKAKKSRQIIISTHNANLVVNADAEQIIVARLDQAAEYTSGSIENPDINRAIRDILEGGELAFLQRERKYQIGN